MHGQCCNHCCIAKMRIRSLSSIPESNRQKSLYSSGKAKFLSVQVMATLLFSLFFCFCLFRVLFKAGSDGMDNWTETSSTVATCVAITAELTGFCSFLAVNFILSTICRASVCQVLYRGCDRFYLKEYDLHKWRLWLSRNVSAIWNISSVLLFLWRYFLWTRYHWKQSTFDLSGWFPK